MRNLRKSRWTWLALLLTASLSFGLGACDVDKTQEGEMPSVDVDVEGGQLPEYDVEGPEVDVDTKTVEVEVPDVDVTMPDEDPDQEPPQ